ncbi:MAG: HmuY family protein [Lentimicrobiaceae bacterium]
MLRILFNLMFMLLAVLVSSCFKEDEIITPHVPGNYITDTIPLTENYEYQIYYALHDSSIVKSNVRTSWDLGFENSPSGWRVILNSSCFMKSAFLSGQVFGAPADTTGAEWLFNPSDGSADSLAIGNWFSIKDNDTIGTNRLLLIDRGMDAIGNPRGFSQLVIDSLSHGTYYFRMAAFNGSNPRSFSVSKKGDVNYLLYSISNPTSAVSEPLALSWDLLFSQYTTLLYTDAGDEYPYLVTGVLLNSKFTEVAVDSITPFQNIDYELAQSMSFTKQADRIGYDWKKYDFGSGIYTVNTNLSYIIRDTKGYLYKFRFVGFYKFLNKKLQKGYPSFEYQKL